MGHHNLSWGSKAESQLILDLINHRPPLRSESCFWFRGQRVLKAISSEPATSLLTNTQCKPPPQLSTRELQNTQLSAQAGPHLQVLRRSIKRLRRGSCCSDVWKQKLRRRLGFFSGAWKNNWEVSRKQQSPEKWNYKTKSVLAAKLPSKNLGERCRWGAIHQPIRKEKKLLIRQLFHSRSAFSVRMPVGLSLTAYLMEWKRAESIVHNCCYRHLSSIPTLCVIFSKKSSKFSACNLKSMVTCNQHHHLAHICAHASNSMPFHVQMRPLSHQSFGTNCCAWSD